jgi:hypothetical protein
MLGSLPRFSVPAGGPHPLFSLLARRTRGVESVTDIKSRSQGVEELRSPGVENRELTATPTPGPSGGRLLATPRLLDLSSSLPRDLTTEPGRQGLQKSTKLYDRTQYVIENKERHIENEPRTNSILSVFCADRSQKVRSSLKIVARASRPLSRERPAPAHGQDARATAGETPAPRPSTVGPFSWFLGTRQQTGMSDRSEARAGTGGLRPEVPEDSEVGLDQRNPQDREKIQKSWERTQGVVENKGHHLLLPCKTNSNLSAKCAH